MSQFGAFMLLVPELDSVTLHQNRFNLHWTGEDLFVYWVAVTVLGTALYLAAVVLHSLFPRRYHGICVVAAMSGIAFLFWRYFVLHPSGSLARSVLTETPVAFFLGALIAGLSWSHGWSFAKWKRGLTLAALVFSPTMLLFWCNALFYSTYEGSSETRLDDLASPAMGPSQRGSVYIFVFDAWSYRLTLERGELASEFAALRSASENLFVFENAHSPHDWTLASVPRLIFGRDDDLEVVGGRLRFRDGEDQFTDSIPSLFTRARSRGYATYAVGWSMPYQALLGSSVDYVRSSPEPRYAGESLWKKFCAVYWRGAIKLFPAGIIRRTPLTRRGLEIRRRHLHNTEVLTSFVDAVIEQPHDAQFALFHLPVPHAPFVFDRKGARVPVADGAAGIVEQAREQHAYVDTLIGKYVARLRALGKYEKATIVLTADHTWRNDPELPKPLSLSTATRVPLFVKVPGQTFGAKIADPFSTRDLGALLERTVQPGFEPEDLPGIVVQTPFALDDGSYPSNPPLAYLGW